MMKKMTLSGYLLLYCLLAAAQTAPKLYLNFTTHNEMLNENYDTDSVFFADRVHELELTAQTLLAKNVKWNYQTCSKFVLGVLKYQNGASNPNDILEWMSASPNITIDPRPKTQPPLYKYNIADVVHLLDSIGVPDSKTVGGFIYYPYSLEDWTPYETPFSGAVFGNSWQADILWGGGSIPPHTHDAHNFGVWKPSGGADSLAFYTHAPNRRLWLVGNGCAYLVDNTTDIPALFGSIKALTYDIATGVMPADQFYCLSITFNTRDLSAAVRLKLGALSDSINTLVAAGQVQWATIQEKRDLFQAWSDSAGIAYSQWACGQQQSTATQDPALFEGLLLTPNPVFDRLSVQWVDGETPLRIRVFALDGRLIRHETSDSISVAELPGGLYVLEVQDAYHRTYRRKFIRG